LFFASTSSRKPITVSLNSSDRSIKSRCPDPSISMYLEPGILPASSWALSGVTILSSVPFR
jgi:hypothetical protein